MEGIQLLSELPVHQTTSANGADARRKEGCSGLLHRKLDVSVFAFAFSSDLALLTNLTRALPS